jgi:hypothetical protein
MKPSHAGCLAGFMGGAWSGFRRLRVLPTRGGAAGVTGEMAGSGEGREATR